MYLPIFGLVQSTSTRKLAASEHTDVVHRTKVAKATSSHGSLDKRMIRVWNRLIIVAKQKKLPFEARFRNDKTNSRLTVFPDVLSYFSKLEEACNYLIHIHI
ncbi:hypothetical protein AH70_10105 [Pediococcus damnosus LMG 28219]|nr:hypothetical protein AH70_10105 [Pediococcus damnosus LMG 28219]PIO81543.1 hypothetical protein BSQ38_07730 [Pediococcus damnosus]PIO84922.1 hypothetical protein BSQ37_02810 [Pediococcus damnosus]PJE48938.1 hypothetical protein BSQ36_02765 [Pediococcus damnosus]GEA92569.1 hypothetical protein PDA01_04620 [Pediococcus damnosus]